MTSPNLILSDYFQFSPKTKIGEEKTETGWTSQTKFE